MEVQATQIGPATRYADFRALRQLDGKALNCFTGRLVKVDKLDSPDLGAPDPRMIGLTLRQADETRRIYGDDPIGHYVIVWADEYYYDSDSGLIASSNRKEVTDLLDHAGASYITGGDRNSDNWIAVDPDSLPGIACDMTRGMGSRSRDNGKRVYFPADPERGLSELDFTLGALAPDMWDQYWVDLEDPLADIVSQCREWSRYVREVSPILNDEDHSQRELAYASERVADEARKYAALGLETDEIFRHLDLVTHDAIRDPQYDTWIDQSCRSGCQHYSGVTDWVIRDQDLFFAVLHAARERKRETDETDGIPSSRD